MVNRINSPSDFYPSQTVWHSCIEVVVGAEWNSSSPDFAREFQESALINTAECRLDIVETKLGAICCLLEQHCWLYTDRQKDTTDPLCMR